MLVRLFVCALLIGFAGVAGAQDKPAQAQQKPAAQQLTPEQRAAIQKQNQELVSYANQILKMIDNGQAAQVWDNMSAVGQKVVKREVFEQKISTQSKTLGAVKSRRVISLRRIQSDGTRGLPVGMYFNVRYLTQFSNNKAPKIELISFHQDSDKKLRLSGYAVTDIPQKTTQPTPKQ